MKFHTTTLANALLTLSIAVVTSNIAVAQDNSADQREAPPATAPDDSNATSPQTPKSDTDCIDISAGAAANAGVAGNIRDASPNDDSTAEESPTEDQSVDEEADSNVQIAENRDDCIDIRKESGTTQD